MDSRQSLSLIACLTAQEFAIEIPDEEADEIKTVQQGIYPFVCSQTGLIFTSVPSH